MKTIMILGAGGFVGRRLLAGLARSGWARPVALVRRDGLSTGEMVERRVCDATDGESVRAALAGADAVVNCVAGSDEALVLSARHLADHAGHARIVHLSSMAVYGDATGLVDEDAPLLGTGGYAGAKVSAERICAAHRESGGDVVVLRPGCIHGPGSVPWTSRLAHLLIAGRLGDLGAAGDGIANLSYIDDLAAAIEAAVVRPEARGGVFNVSDPDPLRWNEALVTLGRAIGATPVPRVGRHRLKAEALLAFPLAAAGKALARWPSLSPSVPLAISPSLQRLFRQHIQLDASRCDRVLSPRALRRQRRWPAPQPGSPPRLGSPRRPP